MATMPRKDYYQDPSQGRQTEVAAERAIAEETSQLAVVQNRLLTLSRLLLEGSGLYAFLDAMETMLSNPVAMIRENGKIWWSLSLRNADAAETWPILQSLSFRQLGRGAAGGFFLPGGSSRIYACPLELRGSKQAFLLAVARGKDITPLDALSVDRIAALAGMELENTEAVKEVESKYLGRFLQDWLAGKITSETDWKRRADVCGWNVPEGMRLCAVQVGWRIPAPSPEKLREAAYRLQTEKFREKEGLLASPMDGELALVVSLPDGGDSDDPEAAVEKHLRDLLPELRSLLDDSELKLYAGRIAERPEDLPGSWIQAARARQVAEVCGLTGEILVYGKLGVYTLLYLIPDGDERVQFLKRYVHPLWQADRKGNGRLSETLEMFFRCNGNIKLTSERLFAHYNTVVYRLEKIQNILGVSLDDPEDRLQLQLALKLGQIDPNRPA